MSKDKAQGATIGNKEQPYEWLSKCMDEWVDALMVERKYGLTKVG